MSSRYSECDLPLCFQKLIFSANNVIREARLLQTQLNITNQSVIGFDILPVIGNITDALAWQFVNGAGEIYRIGNTILIPLSFERSAAALAALVGNIPAGFRPAQDLNIAIRAVVPPTGATGPLRLNISAATGDIIIATLPAPAFLPSGSQFNYVLSYPVP